ncbi:MAG: hypothetical protein HY079_13150, partial [Elusimicrobia bacterium]|nr:hypothetical protein [Elusimicrobiota bacterium]
LVSLDAPERLRGAYRGWAVVVHRDLLHEEFPDRFPDRGGYRPAAAAAADLTAAFGPPACADGAVSVFRVP